MKIIYAIFLIMLLTACNKNKNNYVCTKITDKDTIASLSFEKDKATVKSESFTFCGKSGNVNYYMNKCNDNYKEVAEVTFDVVSLEANVYYIGNMHCK